MLSHLPEIYTNIDTQVEKRRNNNRQPGSNPRRPKHPDRRTKLKHSDSALHPQHHNHKKGRPHHKLPTSIHPRRRATILLSRAKKAGQPTGSKSKERRKSPSCNYPVHASLPTGHMMRIWGQLLFNKGRMMRIWWAYLMFEYWTKRPANICLISY